MVGEEADEGIPIAEWVFPSSVAFVARFALPISAALRTDALTVPPDATVSEFFAMHMKWVRNPTATRSHSV